MPLFAPNMFVPGDREGMAVWLAGHYHEHRQFIELARTMTNPVELREYDILTMPPRVEPWLLLHYDMHRDLRRLSGVSGIDLSLLDWQNPQSVSIWLEEHAKEHESLQQFFGVV